MKSVTPTTAVEVGEKFTVECIDDYTPSHAELRCKDDGTLNHQPECEPDGEPVVDPGKLYVFKFGQLRSL